MPWAIWYPLRRRGTFESLSPQDQRTILMEHGGIGHAYGRAGYATDIRLACHGLDKNDNDFVIGLLGPELYPLSSIVERMRQTKQTSMHIEHMGPFFAGKAVWQTHGASMSDAILLLAYGGPDSLEDIPAFLLDIRGGRETPQALIDEISERYREIGGSSPLLRITESAGREAERGARLARLRRDAALASVHSRDGRPDGPNGVERCIAICMAPHYSSHEHRRVPGQA